MNTIMQFLYTVAIMLWNFLFGRKGNSGHTAGLCEGFMMLAFICGLCMIGLVLLTIGIGIFLWNEIK